MPISNVFETPFQSSPLDLFSDAFIINRRAVVESRLDAIADGEAIEYIRLHDEKHRPSKTVCVGVNWNYSFGIIQEVVQVSEWNKDVILIM